METISMEDILVQGQKAAEMAAALEARVRRDQKVFNASQAGAAMSLDAVGLIPGPLNSNRLAAVEMRDATAVLLIIFPQLAHAKGTPPRIGDVFRLDGVRGSPSYELAKRNDYLCLVGGNGPIPTRMSPPELGKYLELCVTFVGRSLVHCNPRKTPQ